MLAKVSVSACILLCVAVLASQSRLALGAGVIGETNKGDFFSAESGWTRASDVLRDIKKHEADGRGSPLWLVGVMPSTLDLDCDYAQIVSTYYKAEKQFKPFGRFGMMRLGPEFKEEERALFQHLGMAVPEDDELECLSILRYNAKLADATKSPDSGVDEEKIDNPGLIPVKAADMDIKLWHISTVMTSSHMYSGSTFKTTEELKNFGVDFLSAGHIPLLLYVDPDNTASGSGGPAAAEGGDGDGEKEFVEEGTDSFMHSQLWSTLSSVDAYQEVFAFGITQNESLIDIPREDGKNLKSPTYIAVLPMKDAKIVFPYDLEGNLVEGVDMVMATFDSVEAKLTDYEQREIGVVAHWLAKLKDWLDMVKSHTPTDVRRAFLERAKEAAEKEKEKDTQQAAAEAEAQTSAEEEETTSEETTEHEDL